MTIQDICSQPWQFYKGRTGSIWEAWRDCFANNDNPLVWEEVCLPHCVNALDSVDPDGIRYEGPAWYRVLLDAPKPAPGGRILLHFLGSGQVTTVHVGLVEIARHVGGYDEFTVDLTDSLDLPENQIFGEGKLPLAICCDNSPDAETIPSNLSDFCRYGGLYREVRLVEVPPVSVETFHLRSVLDSRKTATLTPVVTLRRPVPVGESIAIEIALRDPSGQEISRREIQTDAWEGPRELDAFLVKAPRLWSPDSPNLYECRILIKGSFGETAIAEKTGFRSFVFEKKGPFFLNGERLLLRGTHRHEDHAGLAAAMPADLIRQELSLIKNMGANFIRLGHYQQSRHVLDLCDELGLLVWEEIPWCRGGLGGTSYREMCRRMLRNMITQHHNHPSIILWGLGNENDWPGDFPTFDKEEIHSFMSELHNLAHDLDPGRLTAIRRCAFCQDIVDVYSPSIWAGWYRGRYEDYQGASRKGVEETERFLHVEWGADSHAGRHSEDPYATILALRSDSSADERAGDFLLTGGDVRASRDGDWSETYFCDLIDWHLKEQENMPWLTGAAQWVFKDFCTPLRPENPVPYVNQKGVVTRDLQPKESYYVFQSHWSREPVLRIYGHSWKRRWGAPGEKRMVRVYSNCSEVELFLNGISQGKRLRDSQDFPAAGLRWEVAFEPGQNTLEATGLHPKGEITDKICLHYETEPWGEPDHLHLECVEISGDLATLEATILDAQGRLCLDSRIEVCFGLLGNSSLIENLGTPWGSRRVQVANGVARISARLSAKAIARVSTKAGIRSPEAWCEIHPEGQ